MKKMVILMTVMVALFAVSTQAALSTWFEGWDNGHNSSEWTYYNNLTSHWALTTDATSPDPDMAMRYPLSNGKYTFRSIGTTLSAFEVSYSYKGQASGHESYDKNQFSIRNTDGAYQAVLHMNKSGDGIKVVALNGAETRYASADTWVDIKLVMDPANMQFSWYFNDAVVETLAMSGDAGVASADIHLQHNDWTGGDGAFHVGYIDAIDVAVPEPGTLALLGLGGLAWLRKSRQ